MAGRRTTQGSLTLKDNIDTETDPMIERLEAAGAIFHARTTTPEFCLSAVCTSHLWGVTRNPFNLDFGPGGSSGGSAAALAAGLTPLATGTTLVGRSGYQRAAAGWQVTSRPTAATPTDHPPASTATTTWFSARDVGDIALGQNIVSGPHPLDHDSLPDRIELAEARPPAKLRVAWSMDLGYVPIEDEVRENTLAALEALRAAGCTVEEVELGWGSWVDEAAMNWYAAMHFGRAALWAAEQGQREQLTDYGRLAADIAAKLGPDDVARSWEGQHRMYQSLGPVLADYDVLLCPTLSIGAVRTDHDATNPAFEVAGKPVDGEYGWLLPPQFNLRTTAR